MDEQRQQTSFDEIEARIRAAREREAEETGKNSERRNPSSGIALGMRLSIEFVAGVAVGVGLGFVLDRFLGTTPWLMVLFLLLGGGAGVANAWRFAKGMDATVGLGAAQRRLAERQKDN
jgi:ATP synthase protein I